MINRWVIVLLAAALVGAALIAINNNFSKKLPHLPNYPAVQTAIGKEKFTLLHAKTPEQRSLGLGAVPELPKNYGMMFEGRGRMGFWMKGMSYPIDMIWLDEKHTIIHMEHDVPPSSYPRKVFSNPPSTDARFVVEIGAGESKRLGIKSGDQISLK